MPQRQAPRSWLPAARICLRRPLTYPGCSTSQVVPCLPPSTTRMRAKTTSYWSARGAASQLRVHQLALSTAQGVRAKPDSISQAARDRVLGVTLRALILAPAQLGGDGLSTGLGPLAGAAGSGPWWVSLSSARPGSRAGRGGSEWLTGRLGLI